MILGLMMLFGALGVGGWAYFAPGSSGSPAETGPAPDPGIAACQALAQAAADPDTADGPPAGMYTGFAASDNADLRAAAAVLEPARSMTEEQHAEILEQLFTAAGQVMTGCAALGVQVPQDAVLLLD